MGKRKQAREFAQLIGCERRAAYEDARRLAIEIAGNGLYTPVDVYYCGLVAIAGEQPYRAFWMHWHMREIWRDRRIIDPRTSREFAIWPRPQPAHLMLTEQRIACRDHHGKLFSIYWTALAGCQIDIPAERITIDYRMLKKAW
jgi:hypothetical protein